ncbi:MAG: cytidine deaminase [Ignavibacteriales bacterium]
MTSGRAGRQWRRAAGGPPLTEAEARLLDRAAEARDRAYAPYSNYRVGAAVLCDDGSVHTGCNIENASYGLSVCAERVAVFNAVSAGRMEILAVAVVAGGPGPASPCGACRQVIVEFAPDAVVLMGNDAGLVESGTAASLLPGRFVLEADGRRNST